jgi:pyruvate,water dikinase
VVALLERADRAAAGELGAADPEFAAAFDEYQQTYGVRGLRYEVAEETLAEAPEITLATIRDQLRQGYDPAAHVASRARRRRELMAEAQGALASRPPADRARFERAVERASQAHPAHEDNEFYTISAPTALIRYAVLEMGRRLAARGVVEAMDDVFFLEIDEALAAMKDGNHRQDLVRRRKGERAWVLAHPGPASYGKQPGPPPPLRVLPPAARAMMEAVVWQVDRGFAAERSARKQAAGSTTLTGIGASAGRRTGTVRVVMGEHEFGKLEAGDVLVCPVTSPVWSVLFSRVTALVTDSGGVLSHPAIIAREYGIPAVVATGNGTELLKDGMRVTVDGSKGVVEVLG